MRPRLRTIGVTALLLAIGATSPAAEPVKRDEVPEMVLSAFARAYPFVSVTSYAREERDGQTRFELTGKAGPLVLKMTFDPDGGLIQIAQPVPPAAVPKPVLLAARKANPGAVITKAEKIFRSERILYRLQLKKGKQNNEVELDPSGRPPEPSGAPPDQGDDGDPGESDTADG